LSLIALIFNAHHQSGLRRAPSQDAGLIFQKNG